MVSTRNFLLFSLNYVAVSSMCNLMGLSECNQAAMVSEFKFHAFIPRDSFEDTCRKLDIALACIYQPKYMDGCTVDMTFFYDMQRDVAKLVCHDGEYLKHNECLGNAEQEQEVMDKCITPLGSGSDVDCDILKSTRVCITSTISTRCGQYDSAYMDVLAYNFLKSYATKVHCTLDEPVTSPSSTTMARTTPATPATVKSTSGPVTSGNTTSTMTTTKSTTTKDGSSATFVTASLLTIVAAANIALSFPVSLLCW